jgi:hypothetical protein
MNPLAFLNADDAEASTSILWNTITGIAIMQAAYLATVA